MSRVIPALLLYGVMAVCLFWLARERDGLQARIGDLQVNVRTLQADRDRLAGQIRQHDEARRQLQVDLAHAETIAARRAARLKELEHEHADLRAWADTRLPADLGRLLERPALAGAGDYRQWLSGRDAVPAAGQPAADEPRPAD